MSRDRRPLLRWGSLILLAASAAARHGWAAEPPPAATSPAALPRDVVVMQRDRAFSQKSVQIPQGGSIRFDNDDDFDHQIFVQSPTMSYESDEQSPGQSIKVSFPHAGHYDVQCRIHPKMHLQVDVR